MTGNLEALEVVCDASSLSEEEYALVRKDYLGASDSSILCDVNLYKKKEALIQEKRSKFITDEEKAVGQKAVVRMGKDLEPFILDKFTELTGIPVSKPKEMYKFKEFPYLTINFDGLTPEFIPVEAKTVSRFGERYYSKAIDTEAVKKMEIRRQGTIKEHVSYYANRCGIPAYYYTQVQQQIKGADAPYGYLVAHFVETWTTVVYYIPRDEITITHIIAEGAKLYEKII